MARNVYLNAAVEGDLDEVVLKRVLSTAGLEVLRVYGKRGKGHLKVNLPRYNIAAQYVPWAILVDLNNDAICAPLLISEWLPNRRENLLLRVAVPTVEAWLLADRQEMASFLRVSERRLPALPEDESNPKTTLINLARRSRNRAIFGDLVPPDGSTASQGPGYTTRLIEFATNFWNPERAANNAPSLMRSLNSLSQWQSGPIP
ncbi:MAG: hypothetical protein HYX86_03435 [Chloroflexi bacterium]|nr:hypothetical protein [Chloroflexota bacterium]